MRVNGTLKNEEESRSRKKDGGALVSAHGRVFERFSASLFSVFFVALPAVADDDKHNRTIRTL